MGRATGEGELHQPTRGTFRLTERLPKHIWRGVPRVAFSILGRLDGTHAEMMTFLREHQLGLQETLERVRAEKLSLARFGDGELGLTYSASFRVVYQGGSPALQSELGDILRGDGYDGVPLLVTIPGFAVPYYRQYWAKYWSRMWPLLNPSATYGDTSVSREGLFRIDPAKGRALWRAIWDGRDVCYVIGKGSRFDPIDALFDGVASHRTIFSKPAQAYDDVSRLVDEITSSLPRETLVLISLGPAATVLAARLARLGYWALDIGHIANAYRTVTEGAPAAEKTPWFRPR